MKKIFLYIVVSSSVLVAQAQKLEFRLNGGITSHTILQPEEPDESNVYYRDMNTSGIPKSASVQASYHFSKWKLGVSAGYTQWRVIQKEPSMTWSLLWGTPYDDKVPKDRYSTFSLDYIPIFASLDRKFTFHRAELYAGVLAGTIGYRYAPPRYESIMEDRLRLSGGLHAGYTWFAIKKIGVNAEISACVLNMQGTLVTLSTPVTAGIVYRP